jgi:AcrR family transcriptional regulator
MVRTGRRPGNRDTREVILTAARDAFAERGFDGASIRAIAAAAGVDPALVHHYFGNKDQLFLAAMRVPINPADLIEEVLAGDRSDFGERLVRTMLKVWDSPAGSAAVAVVRSAVGSDTLAKLLRQFIIDRLVRGAVLRLGANEAEAPLRATLVASQMAGLIMIRYILKAEPLASTDPKVLAAAIGPTVQRYIFGDLGAGPSQDG